MPSATNLFNEDQRKQIADAIAEAEQRTAAEIVCAVATESGRYDRAESIVGLLCGLLVLLLANLIAPQFTRWLVPPGTGNWATFTLAFVEQAAAVLAGFILGSALASYWHGLRRLFTWNSELDAESQRAAAFVFASRRLNSTRSAGAVLLYVSLFEHRVVVLADSGVMNTLGQPFLDELRETAVKHLRAGQMLATFTETVKQAADKLNQALPPPGDNKNEIANTLIEIHPRA